MLIDIETDMSKADVAIFRLMEFMTGQIIDSPLKKITTGIYENIGLPHNGGHLLEMSGYKLKNRLDMITESNYEILPYGVCDNYQQILESNNWINNPNRRYVILLTSVKKKDQPKEGGWRWHKWGEYIGTQSPLHEYLYHEPVIEEVYCYRIFEII